MAGRVLEEAHDLRDAPISVAEGTEHGQHHEGERDEVGVGAARHSQGCGKGYETQDRLLLPAERQSRYEKENCRGGKQEEEPENLGEEIFTCPDILPNTRYRHRSLQRMPRKLVLAGAERLLTHPARLA